MTSCTEIVLSSTDWSHQPGCFSILLIGAVLPNFHMSSSHPFLLLNPPASYCLQRGDLAALGCCQLVTQSMPCRTSGASERNTLSSCGTHREALMPCCHCQYIWTMMMFPHKYFRLHTATNVWMEEEVCVVSLLKRRPALSKRGETLLTHPAPQKVMLLTPFHVCGGLLFLSWGNRPLTQAVELRPGEVRSISKDNWCVNFNSYFHFSN